MYIIFEEVGNLCSCSAVRQHGGTTVFTTATVGNNELIYKLFTQKTKRETKCDQNLNRAVFLLLMVGHVVCSVGCMFGATFCLLQHAQSAESHKSGLHGLTC